MPGSAEHLAEGAFIRSIDRAVSRRALGARGVAIRSHNVINRSELWIHVDDAVAQSESLIWKSITRLTEQGQPRGIIIGRIAVEIPSRRGAT